MTRKLLILWISLLLLVMCPLTVSAEEFDPDKTGSVTVQLTEQFEKTPIAGAELAVYHVATAGVRTDGTLTYRYTEAFAATGIALDDPELADKLDAYITGTEVEAIRITTDKKGTALCENLPLGLYFIRQTGTVEGFAPCTPFLVTVPVRTADGYNYAVSAAPKTEVAKLTDITIQKVWNTDKSNKATDSVTVELLRDGTVVRTATLSDENNWQVTCTDMPESDGYSIREVNVPKGFTATYQQKGYVFTVTNTGTLVQTGQQIWPIPVLAGCGLVLIGAGVLLLQKKRKQDA